MDFSCCVEPMPARMYWMPARQWPYRIGRLVADPRHEECGVPLYSETFDLCLCCRQLGAEPAEGAEVLEDHGGGVSPM